MSFAAIPLVPVRRTWIPRRFVSGRALRRAALLVAPILAELSCQPGLAALADWSLIGASWTITGTATFLIGPRGRSPQSVLRLSSTGGARLQRESDVLAVLGREPTPAEFRPLVPTRRAEGVSGPWRYALDDYIDGVDAPVAVLARPALQPAVQASAACAVTALHRATAATVVVDEALLKAWVDDPIEVLVRSLRESRLGFQTARVARLRQRLHDGLLGREVQAGWVHGDLWLGNVRVAPDTGRVRGIIDWDCAGAGELPAHDLLHLALYAHSQQRGVSLGTVVAEVVTRGTWPAECEEVVRHGRWAWGERIADSDVALLYWLRYTASMIEQQQDYVHHSVLIWQVRNVLRVLRSL